MLVSTGLVADDAVVVVAFAASEDEAEATTEADVAEGAEDGAADELELPPFPG